MKKIIFQHHKQTNYISKSNSLWSHQWQRGKTWHAQSQFNIPLKHTHTINNFFGGQLPFVQQKAKKFCKLFQIVVQSYYISSEICNYLLIYFVIRYCYIGVAFITITLFPKYLHLFSTEPFISFWEELYGTFSN